MPNNRIFNNKNSRILKKQSTRKVKASKEEKDLRLRVRALRSPKSVALKRNLKRVSDRNLLRRVPKSRR